MIILNTETTPQSFKFVPRVEDFDFDIFPIQDEQTNEIFNIRVSTVYTDYNKLEIIDEQTNESVIKDITVFTVGAYYHTITIDFALVEGHTYTLRIYRDSKTNTRFIGKVFCTDQSLPYSVNTDVYTERTTTNDFIIYD